MEANEIRNRGYAIRRKLGDDYRGTVRLLDGQTAQVSYGFTNAGFRGIEFWDANTKRHHNAGEIKHVKVYVNGNPFFAEV